MGLYIIAIGFIVAGALVPWMRRSQHPWAVAIVRSYGVRASGPDGVWLRADHLRSARGHAIACLALLGIALTVMGVADRWSNGTPMNLALSYPGLAVFFMAFLAIWLTGRDLVRATLCRSAVRLPDHSA
jgi:hypothetical protein